MADDRALDALNRMERALTRIEGAAARIGEVRDAVESEELRHLREAHEALRSRVQGAIGQIDALLESGVR